MASKDNGLGEDPHNNHSNLPLVRVKNEESMDDNGNEPMDDYGEGMDAESRIAHLKEGWIECEQRAKKAEEERDDAARTHMITMSNTMNESVRLLNASEKTQEKLKESLKREKEEREREIEETEKREANLKKENDELHDQMKNLTERLKRRDSSLTEVRSRLGVSESRSAQLTKELKKEKDQRKKSDEEGTRLKDSIKLAEKKSMDTEKELVEQRKGRDEKEMGLKNLIKKYKKELEETYKELVDQSKKSDEEGTRLKDLIKRTEKKLMDTEKELIEQKKRSEEKEKRMKDLIKKVRKELEETQIKAADAKVEHEKLKMDQDGLREINEFLSGTPTSKVNDELIVARKRIEHLEKEVEVFTPKTSNARANKRKRTEAGIAFLCECGQEFASNSHWGKCRRNVTIVSKREGPIRRIDDAKTTPQCIICETYPKSALAYISHLARSHNSTLTASGIDFLECGCGLEVRSQSDRDHSNECDHLEFSIHKLNKK